MGKLLSTTGILATVLAAAGLIAPATSAAKTPKCAGEKATIVGTGGDDSGKDGTLRGTRRADVIVAKRGSDRVVSRGGNDTICGGAGDDQLFGGGGKDLVVGGTGIDECDGGPGEDTERACELRDDDPPLDEDDLPSAVGDEAVVAEDAPSTSVPVLANDIDADGGPKTISSATDPTHGSVNVSGDGSVLTYEPDDNYCNTPPGTALETFSYTLNGGSSTTVTVTVSCVNDSPTAVDDAIAATEDTPLVFPKSDLNANDTDVDDGAMLNVTSVQTPTGGAVNLASGNVTFTPSGNSCGTAGFDYTLSDGTATDTGHVTVTVTCVNDAPVAADDGAAIAEDSASTPITGLLANDIDADGNTLSITLVSGAVNGVVFLIGGTPQFTPATDFCGMAAFNYTVSDGTLTDTGSVTVTVECVNDAPVLNNLNGDVRTYASGGGTVLLDQSPTASVTDPDSTDFAGGTLTVEITSGGSIAEDTLDILPGGLITTTGGSTVKSNGVTFGIYAYDANELTLTVALDADATVARVSELVGRVSFASTTGPTFTPPRSVAFTLTDGDGGTSNAATVAVVAP